MDKQKCHNVLFHMNNQRNEKNWKYLFFETKKLKTYITP